MAARHRKKKAEGGAIKGVQVPGASVMREAEASSDGFKKGGAMAKGGKAKPSFGKKARGGAAKFAKGGSPFSSAKSGGKDAPATGDEC